MRRNTTLLVACSMLLLIGGMAFYLANTAAAQDEYTLDVGIVGDGAVRTDPDPPYQYGEVVTLTAEPAVCWLFDSWSGDLAGSGNPDTITMDVTKTVTATFAVDASEYNLEVIEVGDGDVEKDPDQSTYSCGQTVAVTAVPDPGWSFAGWTGDLTSTDISETITIDGNKSVTAIFTQDEYTLAVGIVGDGAVSTEPDPPYQYGEVVTLTAEPGVCWLFDSWSGDLTGSGNPDTITMDVTKTVTATFAVDAGEYNLEVIEVGDGDVEKDPDQSTYSCGQTVTVTAVPAPGWSFAGWTGDLTSTDISETITIDGDKSVTAIFTQNDYTLTIVTLGQGSVEKDPDEETYHHGDAVTLTATADTCWLFDGWSGDLTGSDNPDVITVDGSKTVTATFTQDTSEYSLAVAIVGGGVVERDPDETAYSCGQTVTLTATADAGWSFAGWIGDLTSSVNPETITIDGDKSVTAIFSQDDYTLTIVALGQGSVEKDPDEETYHHGDVVTLTAVGDPGWSFVSWTGDLTSTESPETITIDGNEVVIATFAEDEYALTIEIEGQGTLDVDPDEDTYGYGDVVTLTATADTAWNFSGWSGDLTGTDNPDTITMDDDKSVTATFTSHQILLPLAFRNYRPPRTIWSDDFNVPRLNKGVWTFVDPVGDCSHDIVGTLDQDVWLSISVPSGSSHDIWTDGNFAPRVMQMVSDTDFEVEVKFQSGVSRKYQMQGVVVEENLEHFLRFDFHSEGTVTKLFVSVFEPAPAGSLHPLTASVKYDQGIAAPNSAPLYMRVSRQGDQWTVYHSADGVDWTSAVTFAHALTLTKIGTYAANAGSSPPAHTAYVDYFFNTDRPIVPEH
jgi:uncharacterized repeat protein (TIGR02543 family)